MMRSLMGMGNSGGGLRDSKYHGVVLGQVLSNTDPELRGRVKVQLSSFGELVDSDWAPVVTPNTNFSFLPEIGENVLVAFESGDVSRPYVIGSVQNGLMPPPSPNADGANSFKKIQTRLKQTITFDDTQGNITIEDATGNIIEVGPAGITITAVGDLTMEAAANVNITAGAQVSITASAGATIDGGASADIKGGTINLN